MTELDPEVAGTAPCPDTECGGTGEPEQDGDHAYLACTTCGFEFGYRKIEAQQLAVGPDGACAIGVPVALRRAVSEASERPKPVSLGLSIPVRSPS